MSHFFMVLFPVLLYFFTPTLTSLDKVTIISHLDDGKSLLIGLFAPKCSPSTLFSPQYGQTNPSKSQMSSSHHPACITFSGFLICFC